MRIQRSKIDQEEFRITDGVYATKNTQIEVFLVTPKSIKTKWTKKNLKYRSSIWTQAGEPVSLGLPKFFNWDEGPNMHPAPADLESCNVVEKLDGSCLIVSPHPIHGQPPIIRTRGTLSVFDMQNSHEIVDIQKRYAHCFDPMIGHSYIFEWLSPGHQIIIPHERPDIKLIGCINHDDYSLFTQDELDDVAKLLKVGRPLRFNFDTPDEMTKAVAALEGQEGVCIYYNSDQWIRKVKSAWYLALHRMKSDLGTLERVIEVYFALGKPKYQEFMERISESFDYEVVKMSQGHISRVCDAVKHVDVIIRGMQRFVNKIRIRHDNRKDQAQEILSSYGDSSRSGFVFALLDGKELDDNAIKKLIYQVLKK